MLRPDGELILSLGVPRSGKTKALQTYLAKSKRLVVWDMSGQYAIRFGLREVHTKAELLREVQKKGPIKIAYLPRALKDFDHFCKCAFVAAMVGPLDIVIEEVAVSTNAVRAVGAYGRLVNQVLKYGPRLFITAQRGQEIDNTTLGAASTVNICRQNTPEDAKYLADKYRLGMSDLPDADCYVLQRHKTRKIEKKKLNFRGQVPYLSKINKFPHHF